MNKQELYTLLVKYFEYLYSKVLKYNDYCFSPSNNQEKQINNFIDYLDKQVGIASIGENWLFDFLVFSFKQRIEQKTRYKNQIPLNWVIGKKTYELYTKRSESWMYWNDLFQNQYSISFEDISTPEELKSNNLDEELREQYIRDKKPLHLCLWTVRYSKKSKYCLQCKTKKDCKEINNGQMYG